MKQTKEVSNEGSLENQWKIWQEENPTESFLKIDESDLRNNIIADLSYVSKMDVKEYILYQKWCEVKEKYPTIVKNTLDGEELKLIDNNQQKIINEVKKNIWIPLEPDDYLKLEPVLEYTDDSSMSEIISLDGTVISSKSKRSDLPERWNTIRNFISTMKNNSNIGRNLNFIVKDKVSGKYLGLICISSDFLDLTPRDKAIGWDRESKTLGGMINYTAIGSTIVPLQPLGYNYVGGKLLALLCLSDEVQMLWKKQYGDTLMGVTTTSLYGKTKPGGLSQYDGLEHWNSMGFSSGSVGFEPSRKTRKMIREWLKTNHTRKYFEWYSAKKTTGQPYKRDHKNRSLAFVYSKLNIPKEIIKADHQRGIYFSPLYDNTYDFLCGKIKDENLLVKSFDTSCEALTKIWKEKYVKGRISQLKKQNKVSHEILFYDDLIYMTWEETKQKYLSQVGR